MTAKRLAHSVVLASLAFAPTAASAARFYYNDPTVDREAFLATAGGSLRLESFETPFASANSVAFPIGGPAELTITADTVLSSDSRNWQGPSDGVRSVSFRENPGPKLTFAFAQPITHFGLNVNDLSFVRMSYADDAGNSLADALLPDQGGPAGGPSYLNRQFFGVVSDVPFSSVQFEFTSSLLAGIVFLDRLYYGVPEPASGLMVLTVVTTGLATRARRPRGVV